MRRALLSILGCVALAGLGLGGAGQPVAAAPGNGSEVDPPSCAGSNWLFKHGQDHPFRIWYPEHKPAVAELATHLRHEMDERIWPDETKLMRTRPVADTQDICLVANVGNEDSTGNTLWDKPGCGHKRATILVRNSLDEKEARDVLAHEFMHALQFSLDVGCSDTWWWRESTGQWAEDFVYKDDNREHAFAKHYLSDMDSPIDDKCDCSKNREYGSYIFPFFIARNFKPELIAEIWHKAQHEDVLDAIDDVLPGGLDKQWPRFALDSWNDGPVDYFKSWDDLKDGVSKQFGDPTALTPGSDLELGTGDLKHMSARYFSFDVDAGVRTVAIENGFPYYEIGDQNKHAGVRAIVELADGSQEVKDWSNQIGPNYCLSLSGQHVKKIVLVYTNAEKTKDFDSTDPTRVIATNVGCKSWSGTINGEFTTTGGADLKVTATLTFQRVPATPDKPVLYLATSGGATWTGTLSKPDGCSGSGSGSWAVSDNLGFLFMNWNLHNGPPVLETRGYSAGVGTPVTASYSWPYTCPDDPTQYQTFYVFGTWNSGTPSPRVSASGLHMSGQYTEHADNQTGSWNWSLDSPG